MMYWNRRANISTTISAHSIVPNNSKTSSLDPSLPSVGCRATYPKRRKFTASVFGNKFRMAFFRTKPLARHTFVLSFNPRFNLKRLSTARAVINFPPNTVHCFYLFTRKSIRRSKASTKFITNQVFVRHFPVLHMPFSATGKRAKPCFVFSVGLYKKCLSTYFANDWYHVSSITKRQYSVNGTIGIAHRNIACKRIETAYLQPRLFDEPRVKAVPQELGL